MYEKIKQKIKERIEHYTDEWHVDDTHSRVRASGLREALSIIEAQEQQEESARNTKQVCDEAKKLLLDHLKKFASGEPIREVVHLSWYDRLCDDYVTQEYTLERVFLEDGQVLVAICDKDGDREEDYARDFSLDEIVEIIKAVDK